MSDVLWEMNVKGFKLQRELSASMISVLSVVICAELLKEAASFVIGRLPEESSDLSRMNS
jgi:hypothetical protein